MRQIDKNTWLVHAEGSNGEVTFEPERVECGDIRDGVIFDIKGYGPFVVAREEIKHMAELLGFCKKEE